MNQETVQAFAIAAIIAMFGFIGWAVWHHFQDEHNVYPIQGPNWQYEYRQQYNGYRDLDYYRYNHRHNNPYYRRNGSLRIGPIFEWESNRRFR